LQTAHLKAGPPRSLDGTRHGVADAYAKAAEPMRLAPERIAVAKKDGLRRPKVRTAGGTGVSRVAQSQAIGARKLDLTNDMKDLLLSIENRYGPLAAKKDTIGLDWEKTKADFLKRAAAQKSVEDYYFLVAELLAKFNDAHVTISLPSSRKYSLPLQFSFVDDKIIVNYVDTANFPTNVRCPAIGDTLVAINGRVPEEFQATEPTFNKSGNPLTNMSVFARVLSDLSEARGVRLDKFPDKLALSFQPVGGGALYDCNLAYKKEGVGLIDRPVDAVDEPLQEKELIGGSSGQSAFEQPVRQSGPDPVDLSAKDWASLRHTAGMLDKIHQLFNLETVLPLAVTSEMSAKASASVGKKVEIGHREPLFVLPQDFKEIAPPEQARAFLNANNFFAGTFTRHGMKVGLLRIPTYMPQNAATLLYGLRYYVGKLQAQTDCLIIDQMDNPGGSVTFCNLLIKSLVGHLDDSKHLRFAVSPSQSFLRQLAELLDFVKENKAHALSPEQQKRLLADLNENFDKVYEAYEEGRNLSDPISLKPFDDFADIAIEKQSAVVRKMESKIKGGLGVDVSQPQNYSRPVFLLTNELDFSGADATPAMFQDYERGPVVGVHTAGAGGTVEVFSHRAATEYDYRLTTSLMVRRNNGLVENHGVTPSVHFALTAQDYKDGFKGTLDRLLSKLGL